jgi:hypothetical protein
MNSLGSSFNLYRRKTYYGASVISWPLCDTVYMQGTFFHRAEVGAAFRRRGESHLQAPYGRVPEILPAERTAKGDPVATRIPWPARAVERSKTDLSGAKADRGRKISKGALQRINLTRGGRILCQAGRVWITLDHGGEDIVLNAGQSRNFGSGTRALVEALSASWVFVESR